MNQKTEWITNNIPIITIITIAVVIITLILFPNKWESEEICTKWDVLTQQDYDLAKNCQLDQCTTTQQGRRWTQECTCTANQQKIKTICLQKTTIQNYKGTKEQIRREP